MITVTYINPLWDRRHLYGCFISQFQKFTGTIVYEDVGELHLHSGAFKHVLRKCDIRQIDNKDVEYKIPRNKKIRVEGSKGNLYDVESFNGIDSCSCPAFKFRKTCKHLKELEDAA